MEPIWIMTESVFLLKKSYPFQLCVSRLTHPNRYLWRRSTSPEHWIPEEISFSVDVFVPTSWGMIFDAFIDNEFILVSLMNGVGWYLWAISDVYLRCKYGKFHFPNLAQACVKSAPSLYSGVLTSTYPIIGSKYGIVMLVVRFVHFWHCPYILNTSLLHYYILLISCWFKSLSL